MKKSGRPYDLSLWLFCFPCVCFYAPPFRRFQDQDEGQSHRHDDQGKDDVADGVAHEREPPDPAPQEAAEHDVEDVYPKGVLRHQPDGPAPAMGGLIVEAEDPHRQDV